MQFRQGDVFLERVSQIPRSARDLDARDSMNRLVLAHGEKTGHAHAIHESDVRLLEAEEVTYVIVGPDGATPYMYGPDADAIWAVVERVLDRTALGPGSHAVIRNGPPGSPSRRIDLA